MLSQDEVFAAMTLRNQNILQQKAAIIEEKKNAKIKNKNEEEIPEREAMRSNLKKSEDDKVEEAEVVKEDKEPKKKLE